MNLYFSFYPILMENKSFLFKIFILIITPFNVYPSFSKNF